MRRLFLLACLAVAPAALRAQAPPTSVIAASRAIDWSKAGVPGGIPNRTTVCSTPSLSSGSGNATANGAAIRSAIASCPANQVVSLAAGTWYVDYIQFGTTSSPVSNVTVRGAGANSTFLIFTNGTNCTGLGQVAICMVNADDNYSGDPHNVAPWTASSYAPGTTRIVLGTFTTGSISNLHIGSLMILDMADDPSDTGNVYISQTVANPGVSQQGGVGNGLPGRAQTQTVTVTSISGSTVLFTPGLYASNWSPSKSPGVWFSNALPISGNGVENMSLDYTGLPGSGSNAINMTNASGNWISNVRGLNTNRATHTLSYQSAHNTVQNSYFYGSVPSSSGYGMDTGFASSDNLFQNNICQHIATCAITEGDSGSVFAYNYAVDDVFGDPSGSPGSNNWQQENDYHHSAGDMFTLREGNEGIGWYADDIHGSSALLTTFRNYWNGRDPVTGTFGPKNLQTSAFVGMAYTREINAIGNVLGTSGYHTIYQTNASSPTDPGNGSNGNVSIYVFGYSGNQGSCPLYTYMNGCGSTFAMTSINNDLTVASTLYRWGNYDTVNAAVQWNNGEVPSGISPYAQPVPGSHALPNSFYLPSNGASAPPFWIGSIAFPALGPDVSGGNVANVGGHVNLTPAANCALNILGINPNGSSSYQPFDAYGICGYGSGGGGTPSIAFSPTSFNFGSVMTGTPPPCPTNCATITISNPGTAALSWSGITVTDTTNYTITSIGTCISPLSASTSCMLTVQFNPMSTGTLNTNLNVNNTNISGMSYTMPLQGVGTALPPPPNSQPPASPVVVGQLLEVKR